MPRSVVQSLSTVVSRRRSFPRCVRGAMRSLVTRSQRWLSVRLVLSRPVAAFCPPKSPRTLFVFRSVDRFPTIFLRSSSPSPLRHLLLFTDRRTEHEYSWTLPQRVRTTGGGNNRSKVVRAQTYNNSCSSSEYLWAVAHTTCT